MPAKPSASDAVDLRFRHISLGQAWCEAIELDDGARLIMRPIQPSDAGRLQLAFSTLTPDEIRLRFMHPIKELTSDYARKLTRIDPEQGFALVIVEAKPPVEARIGGVARVAVDHSGREAEFAIILGREIRGYGLGYFMMQQLIHWCRLRKLEALYGFILSENRPMLHLAERLGFMLGPSDEDTDVVMARLELC